MTLQELYDKHPEWRDKVLVVRNSAGYYEWVGASADVYEDDVDKSVLVFSGN
jgi:hypothetical protein